MTDKTTEKARPMKPLPMEREGISPVASPRAVGLIPTVMLSACDLTERVVIATADGVQDIRGETVRRLVSTLTWIEESQVGIHRLVRGLVERTDAVSHDAVEIVEGVAVKTLRAFASTAIWSAEVLVARPAVDEPQARA